MEFSKTFTSFFIGLIVLLVAGGAFLYNSSTKSTRVLHQVFQSPITKIELQHGVGDEQKQALTESDEIESFVRLLQTDKWAKIEKYDYKCGGSYFAFINGETIISFLCKNDQYGYTKIERGNDHFYFQTPLALYTSIEEYLQSTLLGS